MLVFLFCLFVWMAPSAFVIFLFFRDPDYEEVTLEDVAWGLLGIIGGWVTVALIGAELLEEHRDFVVYRKKTKPYSKGVQE